MMGGDLTVESEFGKGSRFTVTLPLRSRRHRSRDLLQGQLISSSQSSPLSRYGAASRGRFRHIQFVRTHRRIPRHRRHAKTQ
jgi:hypothetical protein